MIMNGLSQGGGSDSRVPVIYTTSYVGTGTYGLKNPNILTFDFVPEMVVISGDWRYKSGSYDHSEDLPTLIFTPYTTSSTIYYGTNWESSKIYFNNMYFSVSEDKKTFNFYINNYGGYIEIGNSVTGYGAAITGPESQYNRSGITYHVLAIGYKEES